MQLFSYCHEEYPVICDKKYVMGNFKSNITTYSMHTPYNNYYSLWISEQKHKHHHTKPVIFIVLKWQKFIKGN
jgi:hypothetical protein